MAIILAQSKKNNKKIIIVSLIIMIIIMILVLAVIFLLPIIQKMTTPPVVSLPTDTLDININLNIVDSDRVKALEPFPKIQMNFAYTAQKEGVLNSGSILATSKEEGKEILEKMGLKVISIVEMNTGRQEPFVSY